MGLTGKIIGAISIVIITIVLLAMTPTVVNQVVNMNTSNWTFTGADGALALLGLVPFVWVASILISVYRGLNPCFHHKSSLSTPIPDMKNCGWNVCPSKERQYLSLNR